MQIAYCSTYDWIPVRRAILITYYTMRNAIYSSTDGRPADNEHTGDVNARSDKTGEYKESSGGAEEAVPQTMTSTDCVQRMVQWISRVNEGTNATLLAGIATLGLVISSGMVACSLAVWLCGVGWAACAARTSCARVGGAALRRARGSPHPHRLPADSQPAAQGLRRGRN